ncbi:MAG: hypothetical protein Q4C95_11305 [Planctomycetia bacterium]|nr:hypothetical protein [Planctomycetia bacterium]
MSNNFIFINHFKLSFLLFLFLSPFLVAEEIVFDFESGDLQTEGWKIVQGENSQPIGNRNYEFHNNAIPYDKQGQFYLTTLESNLDNNPTDDTLCILESPVFRIQGNQATFLIGGGKRPQTYVALGIMNEQGALDIVLNAKGEESQKLQTVVWDTNAYIGKNAVLQVVDLAQGSWAHIRMDDFHVQGTIDPEASTQRQNYLIEQKLAEEKRQRELMEQALAEIPAPILYVQRRQYLPDHHNTATLFQTGEINTESFVGGSALRVWNPQTNLVQTLLELPEGIVRDPTISFDAQKVLFSFRKSRKDDYHIGEMTLDLNREPIVLQANSPTDQLDGFRQLTFLPGVSDIDPIYLPTGQILFSSTREPKFCMCNRHIMCNLYTMQNDGTNIQQIGKSTLFEGHASLLSDGRVIYDRWEYVDRNFGDAQGVWVTNPDGSKHEIFWGNNTASPGGVIDAKVLPGSDSVMICVFSSCHDRPWGSIALVDRRLGLDGRAPVLQTWPAETINWVSDQPAEDSLLEVYKYDTFIQTSPKFEDPFPLSDELFLASGQTGKGEEMGIWVLDLDGNMLLVHQDAPGCFDPMPILATEPPMTIGNRINLNDSFGYFHVSNVYEGLGMNNVAKGSAKFLRVVESPEKRFWTMTAWDGSGTQAPGMAWDDFNNKRILGTVPIEKDGSVSVKVPAERFLYFQLLDENGMMIQSMRSGIMVRPGETNACVGCHESRIEAPSSLNVAPIAKAGEPKELTSWYGPERLFSFVTEVQPVFDQYCLECHDYGKSAADKLILAGDLNMAFNTSYSQLRTKKMVRVPGAGPHNKLLPYSWGSTQSRLANVLMKGHPDPKIDAKRRELGVWFDQSTDKEAFDRIMTWIDINAPYYPVYGSAYRDNPFGRSPISFAEQKRLEELVGQNNLTFDISFSRPEISPCLNRWETAKDKESEEYKEALAIIQTGKERLEKQSRGEDENFVPVAEVEIQQQAKYDLMRQREMKMRQAILNGEKRNDLNVLNE